MLTVVCLGTLYRKIQILQSNNLHMWTQFWQMNRHFEVRRRVRSQLSEILWEAGRSKFWKAKQAVNTLESTLRNQQGCFLFERYSTRKSNAPVGLDKGEFISFAKMISILIVRSTWCYLVVTGAMKTHLLVFEMKIKFMQIKYPRFFANRNRQLIEIDRQKMPKDLGWPN